MPVKRAKHEKGNDVIGGGGGVFMANVTNMCALDLPQSQANKPPVHSAQNDPRNSGCKLRQKRTG